MLDRYFEKKFQSWTVDLGPQTIDKQTDHSMVNCLSFIVQKVKLFLEVPV